MSLRKVDPKTAMVQASRLKAARIAAGYADQKAFYKMAGIPQSTYFLHESGARGLSMPAAERYAKALGNVEAGWLLTGLGRGVPPHVLQLAHDIERRATQPGQAIEVWQRFAAARKAHWDDISEAAEALELSVPELEAFETGRTPLPKRVLWDFVCVTGYPASWLHSGSVEDMTGKRLYRILGIAPELISDAED